MSEQFRLDDLARRAGVASTTVRLYQSRNLLPPPHLRGRVGWYDETHLTRLRLIARLQRDGHSLAGIRDLLDQWEQGRSLDAVIGAEADLGDLLGDDRSIVVSPADLIARFPDASMTVELMQRAVAAGLVEVTDDGRTRVTDRRFLETGADLAHLGVPLAVVLDEWEALIAHTDAIAARFVSIFEEHLAPPGWSTNLDPERTQELAAALARLHTIARQVLVTALDASVASVARQRLGQLLAPDASSGAQGDA